MASDAQAAEADYERLDGGHRTLPPSVLDIRRVEMEQIPNVAEDLSDNETPKQHSGLAIGSTVLDVPQPVENGDVESCSTTDAPVSGKPVSRHLELVKSDVKKPLHTGGKEIHTGVNVENTPFSRRVTLKWHVEWKTTSRNVRELVYRLKWLDGATWKPVTRDMVERGVVDVKGSLIRSLHKFKTHEAERVERLGKDAVRRFVRAIIERNRLRRTG